MNLDKVNAFLQTEQTDPAKEKARQQLVKGGERVQQLAQKREELLKELENVSSELVKANGALEGQAQLISELYLEEAEGE